MLTRLNCLPNRTSLSNVDLFVPWIDFILFSFLSLSFFVFLLMPSLRFFFSPILISFILICVFLFVFVLSLPLPSHQFVIFPLCSFALLLFSPSHPVRRTFWPLWPLTPSLWACRCHRGAEREVEVMRRGQVRPNRSACTSPTSRSASETRTSARCLGYEFLSISQCPKCIDTMSYE